MSIAYRKGSNLAYAFVVVSSLWAEPVALAQSVLSDDEEKSTLAQVAAELKRVSTFLEEQNKVIENLRTVVAVQQSRIEKLQATAAPARLAPANFAVQPGQTTVAQVSPAQVMPASSKPAPAPAPLRWYEKYSFRGYTQFRYNRLFETNSRVMCDQCDRSLGNNNGFFIRRARFILSGDINDRLSIYFQPDFATQSGNLNFGQVRDLYFDVFLDKKKEFRVRVGQSKVPYSFENLQSSQNRLALDRADATNSAHSNERDIGAFFYYAPEHIRKRFADLVSLGLKGSGDYGVFALGTFNGQTASRPEGNNNLHYVTRLSYPFKLKNGRIIEPGMAAYTGAYAVTSDLRTPGVRGLENFADRRIDWSLVVYPQPFGFQAEYNVGKGPQYNPRNNTIETRRLYGGYAQAMYMQKYRGQTFTPFVKYQYYSGGKKFELDARRYLVRDFDVGLEWQRDAFFELTGVFARADRTFEDARTPNNRQKGNLFRLQLQLNY